MPYPTTAHDLECYFRIHMAEVRLDLGSFHLNVHSVTGNVGDTE